MSFVSRLGTLIQPLKNEKSFFALQEIYNNLKSLNSAAPASGANITTSTTTVTKNSVTSTLTTIAGLPVIPKGNLITSNGTIDAVLPVGANGTVLTADNTQLLGIKWSGTTQGDKGGLRYYFDSNTSGGTSNNGSLRFNNATIASVTNLYINVLDVNGVSFASFLSHWADSSSSIKGYVLIKENLNSGTPFSIFSISSVTNNSSYYTIAVTYVAGTAPANLDQLVVEWLRTGDLGETGPQGNKAGLQYTFDTTTTAPVTTATNGDIRFNNSTIGSVTSIYIANNDVNGDSMQPYISHWADSSSTIKGYIVINENSNSGLPYGIFSVSAVSYNATYDFTTITVVYIAGALPSNGDNLAINWIRTGDAGTSGVTSLNSITGAVDLVAGSNITLTPSGQNITIASSGGGGSAIFAPFGGTIADPNLNSNMVMKPGNTSQTMNVYATGCGGALIYGPYESNQNAYMWVLPVTPSSTLKVSLGFIQPPGSQGSGVVLLNANTGNIVFIRFAGSATTLYYQRFTVVSSGQGYNSNVSDISNVTNPWPYACWGFSFASSDWILTAYSDIAMANVIGSALFSEAQSTWLGTNFTHVGFGVISNTTNDAAVTLWAQHIVIAHT